MPIQARDSGLQFELDNRMLIVAFGLLIGICGGFFVLGYYLGRHQHVPAAGQAAIPAASPNDSAPQAAAAPDANAAKKTADKPPPREDLEWYSKVGKSERSDANRIVPAGKAGQVAGSAGSAEARLRGDQPQSGKLSGSKTGSKPSSTKMTYSVQVGAFRQLKEAEVKASMLQAKNLTYVIEPPSAAGGLFLLKVGRFESRADAVGMKLRLQKLGFSGFVKPNQ